jgi:hypothetical protein
MQVLNDPISTKAPKMLGDTTAVVRMTRDMDKVLIIIKMAMYIMEYGEKDGKKDVGHTNQPTDKSECF